jgi:hypothetical protein
LEADQCIDKGHTCRGAAAIDSFSKDFKGLFNAFALLDENLRDKLIVRKAIQATFRVCQDLLLPRIDKFSKQPSWFAAYVSGQSIDTHVGQNLLQ